MDAVFELSVVAVTGAQHESGASSFIATTERDTPGTRDLAQNPYAGYYPVRRPQRVDTSGT